MPNDLDVRRRAIVRAFRTGSHNTQTADEIQRLQQTVAALSRRLDELTEEVRAIRHGAAVRAATPTPPTADEEPLGGRVSVPPIAPATLSNQAFDVLLGAVTEGSRVRSE